MLAVRHRSFASKRADLNCRLLWCYSYRTGKGKQQNDLYSLLACVRGSTEPGRRKRNCKRKADSVDVILQTDLTQSHAAVTGSLLSHSQRMPVLAGSKCSGVIGIAKQVLIYCLAVILEVMHKVIQC